MSGCSSDREDGALAEFSWPERTYRGKRGLDCACALVLLVLASPVMVLIALAVKLTSAGPVFYRGERAGLRGIRFRQLKFRSMSVGRAGGAFTTRGDPRITALGRLLRFLKLDELPQLINVLRGEMSMVGPRPEDFSVVAEYYSPEQLRVLSVRPGLTCLIQVRVFPDFTHDVPEGVDHEQYYRTVILPARLVVDLEYVDQMSLRLDLWIILYTIYCICLKSWIILWRRKVVGVLSNRRGTSLG